jgi:micrococcal nuclease
MYQYKAKLIKVVDGDTVDALIDCGFSTFKKERIRLYGINTPECRTRDKEEKKRGLAAKARLKELIKENKNEFIVETRIDKKGKFGRLLGTLFKEADSFDSFNDILVKEGHATEYYGGKR